MPVSSRKPSTSSIASGRGVATHIPPWEMFFVRLSTGLPRARISVTESSRSTRPLPRSSVLMAITRGGTPLSPAYARYPVRRRGARGGAEAGVDREQAVRVAGQRRGDVEVLALQRLRDAAGRVVLGELDDRDLVDAVLHDVERAAVEEEPVAIGHGPAVETDREAVAGPGVDAPQRAGVALHGDQVPAVVRRRDAVEVVAGVERDARELELGGGQLVVDDVERLAPRVREVRGLLRDRDVVDERVLAVGRELELLDV